MTQRDDLGWEAQAFLCEVPDAVMSHRVSPLAGFWWGFDLAGVSDHPSAWAVALADWNGHRSLLAAHYPDWTFDSAE